MEKMLSEVKAVRRERIQRLLVSAAMAIAIWQPHILHAQQTGGAPDSDTRQVRLDLSRLQSHSVTVRLNLRTYLNDRYNGLIYREVRARLRPADVGSSGGADNSGGSRASDVADRSGSAAASGGAGTTIRPNYFVLEESIRDMRQSARHVDRHYEATLRRGSDGAVQPDGSAPFPRRRGFPASPDEAVEPGDTWSAPVSLTVDPLWSGTYYEIPTSASYEYVGMDQYQGSEVYVVRAQYGLRSALGAGTRYDTTAGSGGASSQQPGGPSRPVTRQIDSTPMRVQGSHTIDILIDADSGTPVLMRDRIQEQYRFESGETLRFDGFALTFFDESSPLDGTRVARQLRESLGIASAPNDDSRPGRPDNAGRAPGDGGTSPDTGDNPGTGRDNGAPHTGPGTDGESDTAASPLSHPGEPEGPVTPDEPIPDIDTSGTTNLEVEESEEGVRLRLKQLRFRPDQAVLLPAEQQRLDAVADALQETAPRPLLVVGHTADVGNPAGQQRLSVERAKAVVDALTERGIDPDRIIYEGRGARDPVTSNETDQRRAQNRRVEIHVLD